MVLRVLRAALPGVLVLATLVHAPSGASGRDPARWDLSARPMAPGTPLAETLGELRPGGLDSVVPDTRTWSGGVARAGAALLGVRPPGRGELGARDGIVSPRHCGFPSRRTRAPPVLFQLTS